MARVPSRCTLAAFSYKRQLVWFYGLTCARSNSYSLPNQPTTYVSMADLYGADNATDLLNDLKQNASNAVAAQTWTDDTVRAGYAAVLQASADKILSSQLGAIEFLQANLGYGSGEQGITFTFQLAVQHAASQGYVHINSSDIFDCG